MPYVLFGLKTCVPLGCVFIFREIGKIQAILIANKWNSLLLDKEHPLSTTLGHLMCG